MPPLCPECLGWRSPHCPAIPGQVGPPRAEQRRREERFCPASGVRTRPERRLHEPTPRSETLQPTSPGASERARRRGQKENPGQLHPGTGDARFVVPSQALGDPLGAAGPGPRAGPPVAKGEGITRFPDPLAEQNECLSSDTRSAGPRGRSEETNEAARGRRRAVARPAA